jgi:hypothetical protein
LPVYLLLSVRAVFRTWRGDDDANAIGIPLLAGRTLGDASAVYLLLPIGAVFRIDGDDNANAFGISPLSVATLGDASTVYSFLPFLAHRHAFSVHPLLSSGAWLAHDRNKNISSLTVLFFLASPPVRCSGCCSNRRSLSSGLGGCLIGVSFIPLRFFRRLPVPCVFEDPINLRLFLRSGLTADY